MIELPYNFQQREYQVPLWNALIHEEFTRALVVWPRRNGKDLESLNILIAKAIQRPGLYFYMAPFFTQGRSIIWKGTDGEGRRFLDYIPPELVAKKNEAHLTVELINGSMIRIVGSDNIDSIVGNNPIGVVFTEFSLHKPEAWHYIRPILAENGGWALMNGTPRGLNHFYQLYEYAKRDKDWFVQYLTRDDTGIPSLEAIDSDRRSGMPESLIEQEYYCSWTSSSEETLIPLDIIEPCLTTRLTAADYEFEPRVMGIDVAYAVKGDKAIIARRQGRMLWPLMKFQGLNNMAFASRIAQEIKDFRPDAIFVDSGRGEGVISRLMQLGIQNVIPVHFSGKPYSDIYINKRAEIWCRMRDWFLKQGCPPLIPDDEELIADLSAPTFEINDRGFIQLESKKSIKKNLQRSTDEGDAVALTHAEEVQPDRLEEMARELDLPRAYLSNLQAWQQEDQAPSEYDVLNHLNSEPTERLWQQ